MRWIIGAGLAIALVVFAWQAGASIKSLADRMKLPGHTASVTLPSVLTLHMGTGTLACQLKGVTYICTAPRVVVPPPELTVAGAR